MKVGLFGTGAYGMALTSILSDNGVDVTMWTKFQDECDHLIKHKGNEELLPRFILNDQVKVTTDMRECCNHKDLLIIAIPVAFVDELCQKMSHYIQNDIHICIVSKGIERDTGLFVHQIVEKYLPTKNISVLSGPSFAQDVIQKGAIGLNVASLSNSTNDLVMQAFSNDYVKVRPTNDIIGTAICSSVKNIIALASGILDGLGASHSTMAMLLTESLCDIQKVITMFGGAADTILSFAGVGDLILTCTSESSRNYTYGKKIGSGLSKQQLEIYRKSTTIEGYYTLESIHQLLKESKVDIPMIDLIYNIVNNHQQPHTLISFLVEKI